MHIESEQDLREQIKVLTAERDQWKRAALVYGPLPASDDVEGWAERKRLGIE